MSLRNYQTNSVRDVYSALRTHQSCVLQSATGSGKTHIAMAIIKQGLEHGRRINFVVDRLTLVDQTVDRFMEEGIMPGVIQGLHEMFYPERPVQIVSVQTLASWAKRGKVLPQADLWVVDECHAQYEVIYDLMPKAANFMGQLAKWIGLTATPWATGMGRHWDKLVVPHGCTTAELIRDGYLCDYRAFGPSTPDLKGVKSIAGDFSKADLEPRVRAITGDVVDHYCEHGQDRKALAFAVNVAHAKELASQFLHRGIRADYVTGRDTDERRREVMVAFRQGDIQVLVNCEVLIKGYDQPDVGCLIVARPTRSLTLHIQMLGRGLRTFDGKDYCLILDHGGNIERLGFPDDPMPAELCMKEKGVSSQDRRKKDDPQPWNCIKCHNLNEAATLTCACCGHVRQRPSEVEVKKGRLVELAGKGDKARKQEVHAMLNCIAQDRGYTPGWTANKYRALFGVWPANNINRNQILTPSPEIRSWVKSQLIAWAKRKEQ